MICAVVDGKFIIRIRLSFSLKTIRGYPRSHATQNKW